MKVRALLVATSVCISISACGDVDTPVGSTGQDEAIRQLHAAVDAARNRSDAAAMAALWSVTGTNVSPMGALSEGRDPIETDLAIGFAEGLAGTEHRLNIDRIYWIDAGAAIADGDAEITNLVGPDGTVYPPLTSRFTSVSVQQPTGEWQLEHMRAYVFLDPEG